MFIKKLLLKISNGKSIKVVAMSQNYKERIEKEINVALLIKHIKIT